MTDPATVPIGGEMCPHCHAMPGEQHTPGCLARPVSVRTDHKQKGERIWYDPSRRCLTVIRQAGPTHWVFVREATPQDKALPYYGSAR